MQTDADGDERELATGGRRHQLASGPAPFLPAPATSHQFQPASDGQHRRGHPPHHSAAPPDGQTPVECDVTTTTTRWRHSEQPAATQAGIIVCVNLV